MESIDTLGDSFLENLLNKAIFNGKINRISFAVQNRLFMLCFIVKTHTHCM